MIRGKEEKREAINGGMGNEGREGTVVEWY